MKIEPGNSVKFYIDGVPKPRGWFEPMVDGDRVALRRTDGTIEASGIYSDWTNATNTPFVSVQDWINYVDDFIFQDTALI